ncbi:hypothetical protein ADUPG1_006716 [Aduncisulcus paluster]|uniref:Uncharacterized protein n=1 Tax=Aduncisulcus paluster TaxID=2918883 RepID=A0ABQ5KM97_9EUKA|nr:hypothetical protein ADUPG1_006716 [Aduncisulcus paluster]
MAVAEIGRKRSSAVSVTMPYSPLLATTFHQFQQSSQSLSSLHLNARRSLVQVLGTLFNMFGVSKCLEGYKKKIEILESLHTPTTIAISSPSLSSSTSSSSSSLHALTTSSSSVSSSSSSSFPVPSHSCSLFTSLADLLECQTQLSGAEEHQGSEGGGSVSSSAELVRLLKKLSGVLRVFLSNLTSHLVCGCIMSECERSSIDTVKVEIQSSVRKSFVPSMISFATMWKDEMKHVSIAEGSVQRSRGKPSGGSSGSGGRQTLGDGAGEKKDEQSGRTTPKKTLSKTLLKDRLRQKLKKKPSSMVIQEGGS